MKKYIFIVSALLWWSSLGIAQSLDDYFGIAAQNNPGLKAAYIEYEAALQKVPQMNTLPDPVLSFGYFVLPAETRVGPQQAKISLTQMFPWFGTLKAQGDVAALLAEARFQSFVEARNQLYLRVASAYYPLYELRDWIQIEQDNIEILESYKNIATRKFENGTASMVDVLRADILLKDAQTNLEILKEKEKPLVTVFNNLLNHRVDETVFIGDTLGTNIRPFDFIRDSLVTVNPMLKALDLKLQAGKAAELAAYKQGLPKLGVGLDYVVVGERGEVSIPDNGKDIIMPMVSISIPIFRGKYNASVKEARLMQESYTHQIQEVANTLHSEYEMTWFEVQKQLQLIALYKQQTQSTRQSLNLLLTAYGNSGKDFEEVLQMQQKVLQYRKLSVTALVQYHLAVEKINYLFSKTDQNEIVR